MSILALSCAHWLGNCLASHIACCSSRCAIPYGALLPCRNCSTDNILSEPCTFLIFVSLQRPHHCFYVFLVYLFKVNIFSQRHVQLIISLFNFLLLIYLVLSIYRVVSLSLAGLDQVAHFRVVVFLVRSGICAVWIYYLLELRCLLGYFLIVDGCQEHFKVFLSLFILIFFKISSHGLRFIKAVLWFESQILCYI